MTNAEVSRVVTEVMAQMTAQNRLSRVAVESMVLPLCQARVSRLVVEVVGSQPVFPDGRWSIM